MPSTRSSGAPIIGLVEEIDRLYHRRKRVVQRAESVDSDFSDFFHEIFHEEVEMARPAMKTFVQPNQERMKGPAIALSAATRDLEIKNHMFQQLPKFYGMNNEDVMGFLRDLDNFINNLPRPGAGVTDDELKMKVFAMGLGDKAKAWLSTLEAGSLTTWAEVFAAFMERYFPHTKTTQLKSELISFRQDYDETIYSALERFKDLMAKCPHHGFEIQDQVQYFYQGLNIEDRRAVDFQCKGNIWDESPEDIWACFERLAKGSQFDNPRDISRRKTRGGPVQEVQVNGAQSEGFEGFAKEMKQALKQSMGAPLTNEVCGVCKNYGHGAHMCRSDLAREDAFWVGESEKEVFAAELNGNEAVNY